MSYTQNKMKKYFLLLIFIVLHLTFISNKAYGQNDSIVKICYSYYTGDSILIGKTTYFLKTGITKKLEYSSSNKLIYKGYFHYNRPTLVQVIFSPTDVIEYSYEYNEKGDIITYIEKYSSLNKTVTYNIDNIYMNDRLVKQDYWITFSGLKTLYSTVSYLTINDFMRFENTVFYEKKGNVTEYKFYRDNNLIYKEYKSKRIFYIYDLDSNLVESITNAGETWIYSYNEKKIRTASELIINSYGLSEKKSFQLYDYYANDSIKSIEYYDGRGQLDHKIKNYFFTY